MADSVRPVIEAIWSSLGLPHPVDRIGAEFTFEANGADVTVSLAPSGQDALLRVLLGHLATDPVTARDQAVSILRQGLGLMAVNRASLSLAGETTLESFAALDRGGASAPVPIYAEAVVPLGARDVALAPQALTDLLQWHALVAGNLAPVDRAGTATAVAETGVGDEMMIFRP